jgi:hypothetical protein
VVTPPLVSIRHHGSTTCLVQLAARQSQSARTLSAGPPIRGPVRLAHRRPAAPRSRLATRRWSPRIGLTLQSRLEPTAPPHTRLSSPAVPLTFHSQRGHTGATSGPRTTGLQRTTTVTSGPAFCQLIGESRASAAGHHHPALPDTEEVASAAAPMRSLLAAGTKNPSRFAAKAGVKTAELRQLVTATGSDGVVLQGA